MRSSLTASLLLLIVVLRCCHSFTLRLERKTDVPSTVEIGEDGNGNKKNFQSTRRWATSTTASTTSLSTNSLETVKSLTEIAIYKSGTRAGMDALKELSEVCQERRAFAFNQHDNQNDKNERLISHLPGLLSEQDRVKFLDVVQYMERNEWISSNPDSVDFLPSLHLNLVSQGKPLFPPIDETTALKEGEHGDSDDFEAGIQQLYRIIQPFVYDVLLPKVKDEMTKVLPQSACSSNVRVSDVFLRRYGQDICGGDRNGISAHYDVFSKVTAVIALDDVASNGRNGLFTTVVDEETGETSNHKACRRFFPLQAGDAVVHSWDVLHGVDVEPGLDRTSLIVWFDELHETEGKVEETESSDGCGVSPWLTRHKEMNANEETANGVLQFVLASALSSVDDPEQIKELPSPVDLYLRSASRRNTFALTRMGGLCEDDSLANAELHDEAVRVLEFLRPREILPSTILKMLPGQDTRQELAIRFWLEGAMSGNPNGQKALADEIMMEASQSGSADGRLLAAVLFALAAQQDDDGASESLSRVIEHDVASRGIDNEDAFLASPVVQVAHAAIAA